MERYEYRREGVEDSKIPSSLLEYGKQFLHSTDKVMYRMNTYNPAEKTDNMGAVLNKSEHVATKKLSHNANERKRRKILNGLYGELRSLFPCSVINNKKQVSNPAIVCGILKYIPQLRREIETLSRHRDELLILRRISQQTLKAVPADLSSQMRRNKLGFTESLNAILTEVSIFGTERALIIIVQTAHAAPLLFSRLFLLFEEERLDTVNASTFISKEKAWHSIQVKAMESSWRFDTSGLRLKILRLCEQTGGHFVQRASACFQA